jgi:hypothetical protein
LGFDGVVLVVDQGVEVGQQAGGALAAAVFGGGPRVPGGGLSTLTRL